MDEGDPWHVVVAPRPVLPPGAVPAPAAPPSRRAWHPSRGFLVAVALVVAGFAVLRVLGVHQTGPPDRTVPGAVVSGPAGGVYAFESVHPDGDPVRWNPCEPIRYVVDLTHAPAGAASDLAGAIERITEATGLVFEYDGATDEAPASRRTAYQPDRYGERWAPLLVTWYPLSRTDLPHRPDTVGVGAPLSVVSGRRTQIVSGQVVLNSSRRLRPGFGTQSSWGGIVMHELAHAIGLGHVPDPGEVMYDGSVERYGSAGWGPGDREGLRRLGRDGGCLPTPEPGPVTFD